MIPRSLVWFLPFQIILIIHIQKCLLILCTLLLIKLILIKYNFKLKSVSLTALCLGLQWRRESWCWPQHQRQGLRACLSCSDVVMLVMLVMQWHVSMLCSFIFLFVFASGTQLPEPIVESMLVMHWPCHMIVMLWQSWQCLSGSDSSVENASAPKWRCKKWKSQKWR